MQQFNDKGDDFTDALRQPNSLFLLSQESRNRGITGVLLIFTPHPKPSPDDYMQRGGDF